MLVGYMRVSTAEQSLDLQRDALLAAGVEPERIYEDTCSGAIADRPGLTRALEVVRAGDRARGRTGGRPPLMTRAKLRMAMAMVADRGNAASDVAEQLGISTSTLYAYVDGKGQPKAHARKLLGGGTARR